MSTNQGQQQRVVLTEEAYHDNLSQIIQRQFFPDLVYLRTQATLQQCRDAGDFAGAIVVRRAARRLHSQLHEELLQNHEASQASGGRLEARTLHLESLTGFHTRVTSEDNAEFERVQQKEMDERKEGRARMRLLPSQKLAATCNIDVEGEEQRNLKEGIPSPRFLASDAFTAPLHRSVPKDAALENSLFFVPPPRNHHQTGNSSRHEDDVTRLLMPPPALQGKSKPQLVEHVSKNIPEKRIEPACTRFPWQNRLDLSPHQNRKHFEESTTDEDGGGDSSASSTGWDETDLDSVASSRKLFKQMEQGLKRKTRELQTLVRMTPLIHPNDSPIVTWGGVAATPLVLRPDTEGMADTVSVQPEPAVAFQMPATTSRERAAALAEAKLQDRALKAKRHKSASSTISSPSSLSLRLSDSLSSSLRLPDSARSRSAFGSALRSAYNVTATGKSSRTRTASRANSAAPKIPRS